MEFNIITCPHCNHAEVVLISEEPLKAHRCRSCWQAIEIKPDSCCLFCAYGILKCQEWKKAS